jgi:ribosomal protein S27AE
MTVMEAHIISGRLNAECIPTVLVNEHHISANWSLSVALDGVKIQVPNKYIIQAKEVVRDIEENLYKLEFNDNLEKCNKFFCPKCQSSSISSVSWSWRIALIAVFIFHIPLPFENSRKKCNKCNYKWIERKQNPYSMNIVFFAMLGTIIITSLVSVIVGFILLSIYNPHYN